MQNDLEKLNIGWLRNPKIDKCLILKIWSKVMTNSKHISPELIACCLQ